MGFKRFSLLLSVRIVFIMLCLAGTTSLWLLSGYLVTSVVAVVLLAALVWETLSFIGKTNAELTRFLEALRYGEFNQRFDYKNQGTGFEQLGQIFTEILARFNESREEQEQTLRYLNALVEQVPVPLISLQSDGQVHLWNHSARKLFGSNHIVRLEDIPGDGCFFSQQLEALQPGQRQLAEFEVDGMSHQLSLSATQISIAGRQEKLISLLDIRSELDDAQLQAWQELVRVLTHEIMNSITPVASLADTTADLVGDIQSKPGLTDDIREDLNDVSDAAQTLSRRSNSLMHFVSSYRRLTRLPPPQIKRVQLKSLLQEVLPIASQGWQENGIQLASHIEPHNLQLMVDPSMLEQVLINLLQNAAQALEKVDEPKVTIKAFLNKRSHAVIQVFDNGSGIDAEILDKVFVPFFTTKREGSGVGLALTRQVMIAHGGSASAHNLESGGACFTLTF